MIDTHCHLDVEAFDADRDDVIERAIAAGVTGMLVPAIRPRTWVALLALCARQPALRCAIGIHPQIVPSLDADELGFDPRSAVDIDALAEQIARAADAPSVVAIGECGLDGGTAQRERQTAILRAHVRAAIAVDKPLVVHVLRAHDTAPAILREEGAGRVGGVMHSYSGGADLVGVYRELGMAFSFAGPITYGNARRPVEAARAIPDELLLAETDAPDQAPETHRGSRSEPAYVREVIAGLARARGRSADETAEFTQENARRLFRW